MNKNLILVWLCISSFHLVAQEVYYSFANAQNTSSGGFNYYEADIMIASGTTGFKLGQSTIYMNYNTTAFGLSVVMNGALTVTNPAGYVLGQTSSGAPIYATITPNDNTSSRLAISWLQGLCSGLIPGNNVTLTPTLLLHIKLKYAPGGLGQAPSICWQTGNPFEDQTRTACGPTSSCFFAECSGTNNGNTLTSDFFDCAGAALLPLDLLHFDAFQSEKSVRLNWLTVNEKNTSHFEIERSENSMDWVSAGEVQAKGFSEIEQSYSFWDLNILTETNARFLYYRLRMTDLDGAFSWSPIRSIQVPRKLAALAMYPNPVKNNLFLDLNTEVAGETKITIYSILGSVEHTQTWQVSEGSNPLEIPVKPMLPKGCYMLQINHDRFREVRRFLVD